MQALIAFEALPNPNDRSVFQDGGYNYDDGPEFCHCGKDPKLTMPPPSALTKIGRYYDPLALDLDGDGIETVAADGSIMFDHDGDGIRTGIGWIGSDDGLLVFDRNGDEQINSGAELFGEHTFRTLLPHSL